MRMYTALKTLGLSFVLLFLCIACDRPQLSPLPADAVILAFGDSITFGTGAPQGQDYPAVLARLIGRRVVNGGVPGETTAKGKERLPKLLEEIQPHLVLLEEGGNDFLRRVDRDTTRRNLQAMIDSCRDFGVPVVLIAVPQPGLLLSDADLYQELAESNRLLLIDDELADILSDRDLKSDTIHPNAAGYRRLAEAVMERLRQHGAIE
ncbi:MAG: arylesterase [Geothermobacteraceae bacterium]